MLLIPLFLTLPNPLLLELGWIMSKRSDLTRICKSHHYSELPPIFVCRMNAEQEEIIKYVNDLKDKDKREDALTELSKKREHF